MRTEIYLPFLLSPLFVLLSRRVCRRASPRPAAWAVTVAMALLAASAVAALGLLTWPLVARLPIVAHLGHWRAGAVGHGVPVPEWVSALAGVVLLGVLASTADELRRLLDDYRRIAVIHTEIAAGGSESLTVVDDPVPSAHALPSTRRHRGVIVVSTGMLAALDADEREAVLVHEHAHLAHSHRLFVAAAGLAAAVNPLLWPCRHAVAFAVERWADQDAADRAGHRVTARALAKAALARLAGPGGRTVASALGLLGLGVPDRIAILLSPDDARPRTSMVWLVAALAAVAVVAVVWATHDTEHLFEVLQRR